ncbi:GntR family transcriptional regulator [Mycolicibacterium smegmatis]|uniref:Regulatory protein GntR, HTH:GntR n=1 Tax=Mycolicibacterium smegmatis (strain MKD8) TaxID=1214915 RepID=A0A2U9PIH1_MYCSE|nr:GntR family transcriptional regulator [Mycolicibacterium smegmatis]AWT51478.1 regulatory protein GntR, HTH:GntR [Mycolicibacterium smegmatis MKD8]
MKVAGASSSTRVTKTAVFDDLRADILSGRLEPGSRLPFAALVDRFGCSIGAIREALQRLVEQGLVVSEWQQGFRVVEISPEDLTDLTDARCEIEVLALRYAIRDASVDWEAQAISAHHILDRTPMYDDADPDRFSDSWVEAHAAFHDALLVGCPNRRIRAAALSLRESAELYRRWSAPLHDRDRDIPGEHRAIIEAVVDRDADLAAALLCKHIRRTTDKLIGTTASERMSADSGID